MNKAHEHMFSPTDTSGMGICAWKAWVKMGISVLVELFQAMDTRVREYLSKRTGLVLKMEWLCWCVTHRTALFQHRRDELQHRSGLAQLCICACKPLCLLTIPALLSVEIASARL